MNYFKGSGACGLSVSPLYKNIAISVTNRVLNRNTQTKLGSVKCETKNTNKKRAAIFTD